MQRKGPNVYVDLMIWLLTLLILRKKQYQDDTLYSCWSNFYMQTFQVARKWEVEGGRRKLEVIVLFFLHLTIT